MPGVPDVFLVASMTACGVILGRTHNAVVHFTDAIEMKINPDNAGDTIVHDDIAVVLYTREQIAGRVREIGQALSHDFAGVEQEHPNGMVLISVLRGATLFMADLVREIDVSVEMDYMEISSYGNGAHSSGVVRILKDITSDIKGRHVVIAEDILDSGLTLKYVIKNLQSREPASITVVTLLRKKTHAQAQINCTYVGFECPDEFVVGYGLDYAERYRNLPYIGILKPEVYEG